MKIRVKHAVNQIYHNTGAESWLLSSSLAEHFPSKSMVELHKYLKFLLKKFIYSTGFFNCASNFNNSASWKVF